MDVATFKENLLKENATMNDVKLTSRENNVYDDNMTLGEVMKKGQFMLHVGEDAFKVKPPLNFIGESEFPFSRSTELNSPQIKK